VLCLNHVKVVLLHLEEHIKYDIIINDKELSAKQKTYLAPAARNNLSCRERVHIQAFLGAEVVHLIAIINSLTSRQVFIKLSLAQATSVWAVCFVRPVNKNKHYKLPVTMLFANLKAAKQGPAHSLLTPLDCNT
jgi:ABC-type uncharacterized transport system permease subunit